MEKQSGGRNAFVKMLSGNIAVQAILSASNFIVGLFLVRRTSDAQYGYYVLISTSVLLSTTLQGAFIQPPMVIRLTRSNLEERGNLIGGLIRDQVRLLPLVALAAILTATVLGFRGKLGVPLAAILFGGTAAVLAALRREFFRMVLFAYRRPHDVLKADFVYCAILVVGAYCATLSPFPAAIAALTLALASLVGSQLLSRALWRHEPWNRTAPGGILREILPQGGWSAFGGGVHWLFSQGYNYLVAGTLDVTAVAALAATRLLVMPVGLLSTGIGTFLLPTVSKWSTDHSAIKVLKRLSFFASGLVVMAGLYIAVMWFARIWIFEDLLKKTFAQRDELLLTWSAIALVTAFRDQIYYFLVTRARFRLTSTITLVSAIVSLSTSLLAMHALGVIGALVGLLVGEAFNVVGIIFFSVREAQKSPKSVD